MTWFTFRPGRATFAARADPLRRPMPGPKIKRRPRSAADALPIGVTIGLVVLVGPMIATGVQRNANVPPGLFHPQPRLEGSVLTGRAWHAASGDRLMFGMTPIALADVVAPAPGTPAGERARATLQHLVDGVDLRCTDAGLRLDGVEVAHCIDPWKRDLSSILLRTGYVSRRPVFPRGPGSAPAGAGQSPPDQPLGSS